MRIGFVGARVVRRLVGGYEWSEATGFVQEVDAGTAAELLTMPGGKFVVWPMEALLSLRGLGPQEAVGLAMAGIGGMDELAAVDEEGIKRLAGEGWASRRSIKRWVEMARKRLSLEEEVEHELRG